MPRDDYPNEYAPTGKDAPYVPSRTPYQLTGKQKREKEKNLAVRALQYDKEFEQAKANNWIHRGFPVKENPNVPGRLTWDMEKLHQALDGVNNSNRFFDNLKHIDPHKTEVRADNADVMTNLFKKDYVKAGQWRQGELLEDHLNKGQGASGMGKWASKVVPALALGVIGAGALGAAGALGSGPTVLGGGASTAETLAGMGLGGAGGEGAITGGTVPITAGMTATELANMPGINSLAGLGGPGPALAAGAGTNALTTMPTSAINAIQSGALASVPAAAETTAETLAGMGLAGGGGGAAGAGAIAGGTNALADIAAGTAASTLPAAAASTLPAAAAGGASTVATAIPWDTIISGLGNVVNGVLGYVGAGNAADAVSDASDKSAELAWQMYQQGREDLAPWREAGGAAVQDLAGKIAAGPGEFEASPGYQWTLDQGLNAQQNALSAMGANRSGKHIKAATDYAEGLASTEYDNFLRRWYDKLKPLQSMAGLGQTSANQTAGLGANAAANMGNAYATSGLAQGAGNINQTNALTGAITGGANSLLQYNALRNLPQMPATPNYYGNPAYAPGRP